MILSKIKELIFRLTSSSRNMYQVGNVYRLGIDRVNVYYLLTASNTLSLSYRVGFLNALGELEFYTKDHKTHRWYLEGIILTNNLKFEFRSKDRSF